MKLFNFKHLAEVEESYIQHLQFATWAGVILLILGTLSLIHAVFPVFLSRWPDRLYRYFVDQATPRMNRVNKILREKNIEQ